MMIALSSTACNNQVRRSTSPVHQALNKPNQQDLSTNQPTVSAANCIDTLAGEDPIAFINGNPISKARLVDLLLASHGPGVLEQLAVLDEARRLAETYELTITADDVEREYQQSLKSLLSSFEASEDDAPYGREEAESILNQLLARRNISHTEYMLGITRNAYLRAIVGANLRFSPEQLEAERQRQNGPQADISHIQLATYAEAVKVYELLQNGADFQETAERYSANLRTGPAGGRLRVFSANDDEIPEAIRQRAFASKVGELSPPFRAGDWFHIIKLNAIIPGADPSKSEQAALENSLRSRMVEPAMQELYRSLFQQAEIRIEDAKLAEEFLRKHPERRAGID